MMIEYKRCNDIDALLDDVIMSIPPFIYSNTKIYNIGKLYNRLQSILNFNFSLEYYVNEAIENAGCGFNYICIDETDSQSGNNHEIHFIYRISYDDNDDVKDEYIIFT